MRIFILAMLLTSCSSQPTMVYFRTVDILPEPSRGVRILPPKSEKIIRTEIEYRIDDCVFDYANKKLEIETKLDCLKKLP
jgi:hypothetical protein